MTPQNTPKKPLSEAPRRGSLLDQKALQVSGDVTKCDPHPVYEELFYWGNQPNGTQWWVTEEIWKNGGISTPTEIHEKQRAAREYNLTKPDSEPRVLEDGKCVGLVDQQSMQVSWKPKLGDVHPKYPNFRYYNKRYRDGSQLWLTLEALNKQKEQKKDWEQTPEGRAIMSAHGSKRRKTLNNNIALPKDALDELRDVFHTRDDLTLAARAAGSSECFHVDHIYPLRPAPIDFNGSLQRPYVGLHAPWNLQILEKAENLSKSNSTPEHNEPTK